MVDRYEVKLSPHAHQSLTQIIDYLIDTAPGDTWRKVFKGLYDEARKLERMPSSKPIELIQGK